MSTETPVADFLDQLFYRAMCGNLFATEAGEEVEKVRQLERDYSILLSLAVRLAEAWKVILEMTIHDYDSQKVELGKIAAEQVLALNESTARQATDGQGPKSSVGTAAPVGQPDKLTPEYWDGLTALVRNAPKLSPDDKTGDPPPFDEPVGQIKVRTVDLPRRKPTTIIDGTMDTSITYSPHRIHSTAVGKEE